MDAEGEGRHGQPGARDFAMLLLCRLTHDNKRYRMEYKFESVASRRINSDGARRLARSLFCFAVRVPITLKKVSRCETPGIFISLYLTLVPRATSIEQVAIEMNLSETCFLERQPGAVLWG